MQAKRLKRKSPIADFLSTVGKRPANTSVMWGIANYESHLASAA
ncbi:hypothetical protein [Chamaesiphon sp. OTE_20_metabat_361]|nr:hypothetical protein [Chamaesiphon sp. OTE_20_metabat_361]